MRQSNAINNTSIGLASIFIISLIGLFIVRQYFIYEVEHPKSHLMKQSVELTKHWFEIVGKQKAERGIERDAVSNVQYNALLGNDYTYITTTLGSLEAKELSTNPEFAALITRMLLDLDSVSNVGLIISGSFPALSISTLAALQTIGANTAVMSSLGASSFGANQPEATWIDIEEWLRNDGDLRFRSDIVTMGAENDNGEGLTEQGISIINNAAERNNTELYIPASLEESIHYKTEYFIERNIDCLINIGGNQAGLGSCIHAVEIPNGVHPGKKICNDKSRGIISRIAEMGIPFIHLLNIKDLAVKNGIPLEPGINYGNSEAIYKITTTKRLPIIFLIVLIFVSLHLIRSKYNIFRKFYA